MKICFLILLLPFLSAAQTVHVDDDEVKYKGTIKVDGAAGSALFSRAQQAVKALNEYHNVKDQKVDQGNGITVRAETKLPTPYTHKRKLYYSIQLTPVDGGLQYKIDSVSVSEKRRGYKETVKTSEELLEELDAAGLIRNATQEILNQIDMKFQQLIAVMKGEIEASHKETTK